MIELVVTIIIVGCLLWLAETIIPMDPAVKVILRVVVVLALALYVLSALGVLPLTLPVPRISR